MRSEFFIALFSVFTLGLNAQVVSIPDADFKKILLDNKNLNLNQNNEIEISEAKTYTGAIKASDRNISSVSGIESFPLIKQLYVACLLYTSPSPRDA